MYVVADVDRGVTDVDWSAQAGGRSYARSADEMVRPAACAKRRYRRRIALVNGIRSAHASSAAEIKPAGVARPVAVTDAQFPKLKVTVPFISSG
jgi:hypothetical protein